MTNYTTDSTYASPHAFALEIDPSGTPFITWQDGYGWGAFSDGRDRLLFQPLSVEAFTGP